MKFKKATIRNFRLLRDLEIDFSVSNKQPLTVIRAENETGKTTILNALQWALFGDDVLPNRGREYRIHPIDWNKNEEQMVDIEVEIEFEHTFENRDNAEWKSKTEDFIAVRRVAEKVLDNGNWKRESSEFSLYRKEEGIGVKPIKGPELYLRNMLGSNLKDLIFTDGDRALSFITAQTSTSDRRKLVQRAIRDMLGIEVLENSIKHIENYTRDIRGDVDGFKGAEQVKSKAKELEGCEKKIEALEERLDEIEIELTDHNFNIDEIESKLESALKKGDRKSVMQQIKSCDNDLKKNRGLLKEEKIKHSKLLESKNLFLRILKTPLSQAENLLNELWEDNKIPRTAIPVLKEYLKKGKCVCGRPLEPESKHYHTVDELIKQQERSTDTDKRLTELRTIINENFSSETDFGKSWYNDIKNTISRQNGLGKKIEELERQQKLFEKELENIPETNVEFLREQRKKLRNIKDGLINEKGLKENKLLTEKQRKRSLELDYEKLLKKQDKSKKTRSKLIAANDLYELVQKAYKTVEVNELTDVSNTMNKYFLEMIRSDPKQKAIIRKVEITNEYDIKVYGPGDKTLHPDRDLNGASRRALTLSFILALTHVSGVEAPNVIDTPLGMMDPLVKQSVLESAINHSPQLILLLTRSEIRDCEELIDEYGGKVFTLSNSAHYDTMLVNNPDTDYRTVLKCECDHRQYCTICERITDNNSTLIYRD